MTDETTDELLFAYGSTQFAEVQLDVFGRIVAATDDLLPGYTVDYVDIDDPRASDVSGVSVHPVIRPTGNPVDKVVGKVLRVSSAELEAADEYEMSLYRRTSVRLASGRTAWVFVG